MKNRLLLGMGRMMIPIPAWIWQRRISRQSQQEAAARLANLSDNHHRVRDFVVRELPRATEPLTPVVIGRALDLPPADVAALLDDLERRLLFLYRGVSDTVTWAYPVTSDTTPHHLTYSTGEDGYAA